MNNDLPSPAIPQSLGAHHVFARLTSGALALLASHARRLRVPGGAVAVAAEQLPQQLVLVEDGALVLSHGEAGWSVKLETGDLLGAGVTPAHLQGACHAIALQDSTLLFVPIEALLALCRDHPAMAVFFPALPLFVTGVGLTKSAGDAADNPLNLLATPVRALVQRTPVILPPETSIRSTAETMREQRVSSILLVEREHLFGVVTDRDLRNRAVAQGLDTERPVADIATLAPFTVQGASPAFEALLLMARHNIHHVPVLEGTRIAGMLTATDLTEQHTTSAVYLAGDIYQQTSVEGLARISARVSRLQQHLAAANASAYSAGHIITTITDALTTRLIHLAEAELGPAPVSYVWVAAGSQARNEQTAKTDQDNCMVLDDAYDEARHGEYFRTFSRFVCDGLAACGYIHCPGEMMAMTDKWRQPRHRWSQYFRQWIDQPDPMALMLTSVFFDQRAIHGTTGLLDSLRREVLRSTRGKSLFLSHMVGNALKHRPPLGLFGHIALTRGGEHGATVDLKHGAIVPIVDLARVYALAGGLEAVNTQDRLEQAGGTGEVTADAARDLRHALEFLGKLRIAHQARQTAEGRAPDNFLAMEELSNFERSHLKDAFSVVQRLQAVLSQRYGSRY
jgi:CBS domain-containing protein